MQDLKKMITKFEKIVSPNFCNSLAKQVQLVQRSSSKLKGHEFAQALMIPNAFLESETLHSISVRMKKINNECDLSASALTQRLNTMASVIFMKACFEKIFNEIINQEVDNLPDLDNLKSFNRVLIEDSTMAELHEKLAPEYKGRGGAASIAAVKIDFIFDYLSERIVNINFFSGNIPDVSLADRLLPMLMEGDLVIRDLGYFALDNIKKIELKKAFYISRFKSNVAVYESKDAKEPLDLAYFLKNKKFHGTIDVNVFIGKEKHPVRLVACKMSEGAVAKRHRDANRNAQRCRTNISKQKLNLLKFSILITNIPLEVLSDESIMATYRARWRVELIFKEWKSCLKIHLFKGYRIERFHTLLYARLAMVMLLGAMAPHLMRYAFEMGRELSSYKFIKYMVADHTFATSLIEGKVDQFLETLFQDILRRLCKDKRRRLTLRSNVNQGQSYYNNLENKELQRKCA